MPNENLTEIVFVIDQSGSMATVREDTIGSFNTFVEEQREVEGDANFTLTLFNSDHVTVYESVSLARVEPLSSENYRPTGGTALCDAVCTTIDDLNYRLEESDEADRAGQVIFVILTDGRENSSQEHTNDDVATRIANYEKKGWEFVFMGADIDSFAVASQYNIKVSNVDNYAKSSEGMNVMRGKIGKAVTSYRSTGAVSADWRDEDDLADLVDPNPSSDLSGLVDEITSEADGADDTATE